MLKSNYAIEYLNKKRDALSENLKKSSFSFKGISKENVHEKIMQEVTYQMNMQLSFILEKQVENLKEIDLRTFVWDLENDQIKLKLKENGILFVKIIYRWLKTLIALGRSLFVNERTIDSDQVSIITNVSGRFLSVNGCVNAFEDFLKDCPLTPLNKHDVVIVGAEIEKDQNRIHATLTPFYSLLKLKKYSFVLKLKTIFVHILNLLTYFVNQLFHKNTILFGTDISEMSIIEVANENEFVTDIMFLHSLTGVIPIWASFLKDKKYESHMVWYSVNSRPIMFKDQPINVHQPFFKYNNFDCHWVWTKEEKRWIEDCQEREVNAVVCGPILFGQDSKAEPIREKVKKVLIFDTPPHIKNFTIPSDSYLNYVTLDVSIDLIKDTISAVENVEEKTGQKIEIYLKPKKAIGRKGMIPEYYEYMQSQIDRGRLIVLPLTENIARIIQTTDCLIAHPFSTSTKYAHHIGKTGVHYDPTGKILDDPYDGDETHLVEGPQELKEFLESFYSENQ